MVVTGLKLLALPIAVVVVLPVLDTPIADAQIPAVRGIALPQGESNTQTRENARGRGRRRRPAPREENGNQPPAELERVALKRVAARYSLPLEELEVVSALINKYPLTGLTAFAFEMVDNSDERKQYAITLDEYGEELSEEKLRADEQAAHLAQYGKLHPELFERLAGVPSDEPIDVTIGIQAPPFPQFERPGRARRSMSEKEREQFVREGEQDGRLMRQASERHALALAAAVAPVAARLRKMGYQVETYGSVPNIRSSLPPVVIRQVARWDEVVEIDLTRFVQFER